MAPSRIPLAVFVDGGDAELVLQEVRVTLSMISKTLDFAPFRKVFSDVRRLFSGGYPGYRACNTGYHDLEHTTDTFLAMARLIHGAHRMGRTLEGRAVELALISALMHDTGYLQKHGDRTGTGAKYSAIHIQRSIVFAKQYLSAAGYAPADFELCRKALLCTGLDVRIEGLSFRTEAEELIGKMLGTADLMSQMASRRYLEKLPFLYQELKEGGVLKQESEFDFLKNAPRFYREVRGRFAGSLGAVFLFMKAHFWARWGLDRDPYLDAIEQHIDYLAAILEQHPQDYRSWLKPGRLGTAAPSGPTTADQAFETVPHLSGL